MFIEMKKGCHVYLKLMFGVSCRKGKRARTCIQWNQRLEGDGSSQGQGYCWGEFFNVASILKVLPSAKGENPIRKIQDTYAPRIKQFLDLNTKRIL